MSESSHKSDSRSSSRQHTSHLLNLLRGKTNGGEVCIEPVRKPVSELPPNSPTPRDPQNERHHVQVDQAVLAPASIGRSIPSVGERLQNVKGQLSRLLVHADKLAELNRIIIAYLPPHFHGHVTLATLTPDCWIIHTDSSAWLTRMRYVLPSLQRQLSDHLQTEVPRLKVRVRPVADFVRKPAPVRRLTVSDEAVATLEVAARNLNDPRLSMAMQRLADHARKRVA